MSAIDNLISELAAMPEVQCIAAPQEWPTTQNSYGHYLNVLGGFAARETLGEDSTPRREWLLWAAILIEAGADVRGVKSALRVAGFGD